MAIQKIAHGDKRGMETRVNIRFIHLADIFTDGMVQEDRLLGTVYIYCPSSSFKTSIKHQMNLN